MTVDVVVAGTVFLDLTFEGLEALPRPGEERYAEALHATPGGAAITAIGLRRLGLQVAVVSPFARDVPGTMLRELVAAEGVAWHGPEVERAAVTVSLPVADERAMATYEPAALLSTSDVADLGPRAVVVDVDDLELVPAGAAAYAVAGDRESRRHAGRLPAGLGMVRTLVVNRDEARRLTGETSAEGAALTLAERAETAVVTCGRDGAVAASTGELVSVPAPAFDVRDTTGAGDLFTAAYVWSDLRALPLEARVRRAVAYASLSVRTATGAGSAATLDELEHALAELDPVTLQERPAKESQ